MAAPNNRDPVEEVKKMVDELAEEPHYNKLLTLASTRRHVIFSYPYDMTDGEIMDFLGWITHEFRRSLPPTRDTMFRLPKHITDG